MKKNNKGFTLIEILAVIVVLALIMTISIPTVINTINSSRKEAFYLYAQKLESSAIAKYTSNQDQDDQDTFECQVYDISKDLDIENTGDFEGWVKIKREPVVSDTKRSATITVNHPTELAYVRYCIEKGNTCTPNKTFQIAEGDKSATVTQTIGTGQVLCVNYQYGEDGKLKDSSVKKCINYNEAKPITNSFDYSVVLTFKSREYAVQNLVFNDEMSKKKFYSEIDNFKNRGESEKDTVQKANPMAIASPTCDPADPVTYKGTTTVKNATDDPNYKPVTTEPTIDVSKCPTVALDKKKFTIILNPNGGILNSSDRISQCVDCGDNTQIEIPTRENYIFEGWFYDKAFSKKLVGTSSNRVNNSPKLDSQGCVAAYNDVYLYAKWRLDQSKTTTPTTGSIDYTTTTSTSRDIIDYTTTTSTTGSIDYTTTTTTRGSTDIAYTTSTTRDITEVTTTTTTKDVTDHTLLLDNLSVDNYPIDFSPTNFVYEVTVPNSQESVNIVAPAKTPEVTTVEVTGGETLKVGDNIILVKLTNTQTGKNGDYRIKVSRLDAAGQRVTQAPQVPPEEWYPESGLPDPKLEESNATLKTLMISGYTIKFDSNIYEYQIETKPVKELDISYQTAIKGAFVNITGNENLKDGDVVTIYVQSPNGYYYKEYKIKVHQKNETANQTRYLRTIVIVLIVILVAALIIIYTNKIRGKSIIKKKDTTNTNSSITTTDNNINNGNGGTNPPQPPM